MSEISIPKTIKISLSFSNFLLVMSQMVFGFFVHFYADFMCLNFPR